MEKADTRKLEKIREYYAEHGIMPTYKKICELLGFSSNNAAYKFVAKMIKLKRITKVDSRIAPGSMFFVNK
jgi:hypothetical protein